MEGQYIWCCAAEDNEDDVASCESHEVDIQYDAELVAEVEARNPQPVTQLLYSATSAKYNKQKGV